MSAGERRSLVQWVRDSVGGGPVYALAILFGLNAVDELDRTAFGILLPEIRDDFGLNLGVLLGVVALSLGAALALQVPIAVMSDRHSRVRILVIGAVVWAVFSFFTGLATTVLLLTIARSGSSIGKAVIDPTHNSLLADWFEPTVRPRVYSIHRAANSVGQIIGPLAAGTLAYAFGWRVPFLLFAFPTLILAVLALRLREPIRGTFERRMAGAEEHAVMTEEEPASFAEAWRLVWKIESLRRIWCALPFLAASLIGFVFLAALLYEEVFDLDERARGVVAASVEPAQLVGLWFGARYGVRHLVVDPGRVLRFLAYVSFGVAGLSVVFALAPNIGMAIAAHALITGALAVLLPGILASLSLAIPPRVRSVGFSIASLWVLPGLVLLPIIGWIGDAWGLRVGLLVLVPVFLAGGLIISSAGSLIQGDIQQVWQSTAARSEIAYERRQGRSPLLVVRGLDVGYDGVQVLFGVDLDLDEGDLIALLGTNGAGKSTLLRAISGITEADRGAVIFDGRDITHAPPWEIAGLGVLQVPGGRGVFPSLTVGEHLRLAAWMDEERWEPSRMHDVTDLFPVLGRRLEEPAADLSGGQQQMLALAMSIIGHPRMLMIDELTLGLAPTVVEELMPLVRDLRDRGTAIILVEQSVNLALSVADTAYFMEKGEVRFQGPTGDLLDRPDVLRSVFLAGASSAGPAAADGERAPRGGGAALEVAGLTRSFRGIRAVDDVSLTVGEGEIVGVIGPNGAGKTTLFDLVSGFARPDEGRVVLAGVDVTRDPVDRRARRGLGRSFQHARLFPALTVEETLAVALERWVEVRDPVQAALRLPAVFDAEEQVAGRVEELIELLGLGAFRGKFIRELSTGSRRVVDLACVVAHRPTVVLLDEPSSGIAQREVEALGPLLERLRTEMGASLVVVEHDVPLVSSLADRLIAMDQGAVVAEGRPEAVLDDERVVASYLGTTDAAIARSGPT